MIPATFDPRKLQTVLGTHLVTGFAPGTMIEIEYNAKPATIAVGTQGAVARALNADLSAKITLTLLQTSASNLYLSGLLAQDRGFGTGLVPFLCKDLGGTSVASAAACWVETAPKVEYSNEITNRVWVLEVGALELFVGNNL